MKAPIPAFLIQALLFSAAMPALSQSTQQPSIDPNQLLMLAPQFAPGQRDSAKPRAFSFDGNVPMPRVVIPSRTPQLVDPHLDEMIIRRPPQGAFAQQQPRTPLAGNLYPGLKLLPIETAQLEPIPLYFPKAKVEPIPTTSPNAKMSPILTVKQRAVPEK
jgi:hypothetical protein